VVESVLLIPRNLKLSSIQQRSDRFVVCHLVLVSEGQEVVVEGDRHSNGKLPRLFNSESPWLAALSQERLRAFSTDEAGSFGNLVGDLGMEAWAYRDGSRHFVD
jgi:hypothetical protein